MHLNSLPYSPVYRMHKRTNIQVEDSAALGAGFQGTRGFVARFNAQGLKEDLRTHPDTATLSAFVDSVHKNTWRGVLFINAVVF